ncbi:circadian clock protein KaiA [Leptolyngbya sp. UWPOB_LEPTO1]|uniref:circadian clock protein KaiA n=1 Tax=Leptolyngbya sp. UWPOB_LEPTO1 TaxID=2815653 RepID=UPI00338E6D42
MIALVSSIVRPQLSIGVYLNSPALPQSLEQILTSHECYAMTVVESTQDFFQLIQQHKQQLDCLILQDSSELPAIIEWLHSQATLLPAILVESEPHTTRAPDFTFLYHTGEVWATLADLEQVDNLIANAIEGFLNLSPSCQIPCETAPPDLTRDLTTQNFLMLQQRRLTEKLHERLGYLGVYYKRNPQSYLRNLPPQEQHELIEALRLEYRAIILSYFTDENDLNQRIDNFVNAAFFADISVAKIVEIHMDLMDEFAKQLKLEGRNEEVLLDYRLTLIDTIAHLCEMYRRSIPRES